MSTKTSTLGRIFLALRGFYRYTLHIIAYNTNPLYRALYELAEVNDKIERWKKEMGYHALANDLYYACGAYDKDARYLYQLKEEQRMLLERIDELNMR